MANVVSDYLLGQIPNENVANLLRMIIDAFSKEEFDYWGNVKDQVVKMVGTYINEHNMHQLEVYQKDLEELLDR